MSSSASDVLSAHIIASASDAIISKTLDGVITTWNRAAERIYGYSTTEIVGESVSLLTPEGQHDDTFDILNRIRSGEVVDHYETTRRTKSGPVISVSLTVSPIYDDNGEIIGASSVARDITEREKVQDQARSAARYSRSLIEASLDPLVTISPEGKITDVNEATVRVTGVDRDALVGTDFSDYFTRPEQAREGYLQVFAEGFVSNYPLTIRHVSGTYTDVLYNASVYKDSDGHVLGVFAAARDVTAQKQAEKEVADQRTRELDRLAELERFQKLTIGRELRMIELKKEIKLLKEKADGDA